MRGCWYLGHQQHVHPQGEHYPNTVPRCVPSAAHNHQDSLRCHCHLPEWSCIEWARHTAVSLARSLTPDPIYHLLWDLSVLRCFSLGRWSQRKWRHSLRPHQSQVYQYADHWGRSNHGMFHTHPGVCPLRHWIDMMLCCMKVSLNWWGGSVRAAWRFAFVLKLLNKSAWFFNLFLNLRDRVVLWLTLRVRVGLRTANGLAGGLGFTPWD